MEQPLLDVLSEAVKTRQRKEELERSIGRALRRREINFEVYVRIMSELREVALEGKMSIDEAAQKLLGKRDEGPDKHDR